MIVSVCCKERVIVLGDVFLCVKCKRPCETLCPFFGDLSGV